MSAAGPAAPATRVAFSPLADDSPYTLCILDFTHILRAEEARAATDDAAQRIGLWPSRSLCVLTDCTGSFLSLPVIAALERLARLNAPHVVRSAVVGLRPVHREILRQVCRLSGRDIREFRTRAQALAYLRGGA